MAGSSKPSEVISIEFQPIGKRVQAHAGDNLLEIIQHSGISLTSICAGKGTCGRCVVEIITGEIDPPQKSELALLEKHGFSPPYRLACQVRIRSNAIICVPLESLSTPQRTQLEGKEQYVKPTKFWKFHELKIKSPKLSDLTSDLTNLRESLKDNGIVNVEVPKPLLEDFSDAIRDQKWSIPAAVRYGMETPHLGSIKLTTKKMMGFAVDIGTTKIAGYLIDLESGNTLRSAGMMNPLIPYGEDIISRIDYVNNHQDGKTFLHTKLIESINDLISTLCRDEDVKNTDILEVSAVGNTVMHHLFCNFTVSQLGYSPFVPAVSESLFLTSASLGLKIAPGGMVYLPPNLAGYVGADHIAMLIAAEVMYEKRNIIAIDIGTNTEISLVSNGRLHCCSCASGPAFEGAHISSGMRASDGAIEHLKIIDNQPMIQVIGGQKPVGLCGSGILDAVAELRAAGILDHRGIFRKDSGNIIVDDKIVKFQLVEKEKSGTGKPIYITRSDIHQIQLAKAAIRAGIDLLLQEVELKYSDVDGFIVAGAFGTYLDLESAIRVGMFPDIPLPKFKQLGNAAGTGARQLLVSKEKRDEADKINTLMNYIELTTKPGFTDTFMKALYL